MRWKRALGNEVVSTGTAETAGKIDGLVADPESHAVVAMIVGKQVIPWSDSKGMGQDVVTVGDTNILRDPSEGLEQRAIDGAGDPIGKTVISEDGVAMGSVNDIDFDSSSGEIRRLVMADDDISGSRLIGIGSYAVIVSSSSTASSDGNLDSLSKDELYDRAKERDLAGRSDMTKQELIDALS